MAGPRTPGTAFVLGHHTLTEVGGLKGAWGWMRGGMWAISDAIARAARAFGADIRTSSTVRRILVRTGRAVGVELADGTIVEGTAVLSNADPKRTLLGLVGEENLPPEFARAVAGIRFESSSFKLNLALRELPDFHAIPGTTAQPHHKTIIDVAPSMDYLERAYDDAKRGRPSQEPFLEFAIESANDRTAAPPGMHTLTISPKAAPSDRAAGTWDPRPDNSAARILHVLELYAPNTSRPTDPIASRSPPVLAQ